MGKKVILMTYEPIPKAKYGGPGRILTLIKQYKATNPRRYAHIKILSILNLFLSRGTFLDKEKNREKWFVKNSRLNVKIISKFRIIFNNLGKTPYFLREILSLIYLYALILIGSYCIIKAKSIFKNARVLHFHDVFSFWSFYTASLLSRDTRKIYKKVTKILTLHSPGATFKEYGIAMRLRDSSLSCIILKQLERKAIVNSHALIFPSIYYTKHIINDLHLNLFKKDAKKKIYIVYNGIEGLLNLENFRPIKMTYKREVINKLRLPCDVKYLILSAGRIIRLKGFDLLLKVAEQLYPRYGTRFFFLVIGDGPLLDELRKKSPPNMLFLGFVSEKLKRQLFLACDIFVSPSRRSTFDLAILEAMSAGCAIVATDSGGNVEAISDAGIIVKTTVQDILRGLEKILRNESLLHYYQSAAYIRFKNNFSIETMMSKLLRIYNEFFN